MLLAFDTATPAVAVAIVDGNRVVASSSHIDALRHGELLAPAIEQLLAQTWVRPTDLTRIAVGVGPGPFTGLRVGLVTARTMCAVLGIPVSGVCTLDILAADGPRATPFLAVTDARRKQVYWARYDERGVRVEGPSVDRPADVRSDLPVVGTGPALYPDLFGHGLGPAYPSAATLGRVVLAGAVGLLSPDPLYLRRPDAAEPRSRKRVS